ncbi:MAG TPA: SDR family oxidoreductase [Candidatus Woesebacteria bacterium]|nr:SDR family oxidoreductase [Candidatus Woesebacteria bacterium]
MKKKALIGVTGATGMIGKRLVEELVRRNENVRILVRKKSRLDKVEEIVGDVNNLDDLKRFTKGLTEIYHLAALIDLTNGWEDFFKTNVESAVNLEILCKKQKIRLMLVSTIMTFKDTGKKIRNEKWREENVFSENKYIRSKVLLNKEFRKMRSNTILIYPSIVIDKEKINSTEFKGGNFEKFIWKFVGGGIPGGVMELIGSSKRYINVIEINDLVNGMILAMKKAKAREDYLLVGQNIFAKDYLERFSRICKTNYCRVRIPEIVLKIIKNVPWFSIYPIWLKNLLVSIPKNMNFSNKKAVRHFNFKIESKLC